MQKNAKRSAKNAKTVKNANTSRHANSCAISCPAGLGRSQGAQAPAPLGEPAPAWFLAALLKALGLGPVVLVSPSLSGMYSLPLLVQNQELVRAYIPVAPICTERFTPQQFHAVKVVFLALNSICQQRLASFSICFQHFLNIFDTLQSFLAFLSIILAFLAVFFSFFDHFQHFLQHFLA